MRIHSDFLEASDLRLAARVAGIGFTRFEEKGSRTRDHAFDVIMTGSSPRRQNCRRSDGDYAATWDEWGVFLSLLFFLDPRALAGSKKNPAYASGAHFDWATGGRYRVGSGFDLAGSHKLHRWEFSGDCVTGAYAVHECQCGAVRRMTFDFDAISA